MSANVGEDLRPIAKIASGGELARIMLALKNVLAEQEAVGTLVFDEVDTGVSGRAAQKVAEKLAQVSRRKQVLCCLLYTSLLLRCLPAIIRLEFS